jgi:hypothetical protein
MRFIALVPLALTLALTADRGAEAAKPKPVACVKTVRGDDPLAPERSLAAVRARLAPETMTNQGGTFHLTPGNYFVEQVTWLGPGTKGSQWHRDFDLVRKRCGYDEAAASWRVLIVLSQAQLVLPPVVFIVARTPAGWRVVYRS